MILTEHHLEFQSLKGGCTGSSESTLVKIPHCWKSHGAAHLLMNEEKIKKQQQINQLTLTTKHNVSKAERTSIREHF